MFRFCYPRPVAAPSAALSARSDAKRNVDFHTAADVFAWTSKNMPGGAPGTLSTDQYLAIFAFDLTANGIKLEILIAVEFYFHAV